MLAASLPTKFPIPFADNAGPSFIRPIPESSQIGIQPGAASLVDGFPPLTFISVLAGGVPPWGQDFNGLLFQITTWNQWQSMGGTVPYDGTFSAAIGGYPKGAVLSGTSPAVFWLSLVDNNVTNPNAGGAGWMIVGAGLGALVASAATDIGGQPQGTIVISGNTQINGMGSTIGPGQSRFLIFSGVPLLKYNATSFLLPTAADIQVVAGDTALAVGLTGGHVQIVAYWRADGSPLAIDAGSIGTTQLANNAVTQAKMANASVGTAQLIDANVTPQKASSTTGGGSFVLSASPALSGTPTAPTPATNDDSTKIATTAFVNNELDAHVYAGSNVNNTNFPISTTLMMAGLPNRNSNTTVGLSADAGKFDAGSTGVSGTWAARGNGSPGGGNIANYQRIL